MLTFFATLFVNILVGTIFYLIISLKLEKSGSELHVKKMRREMDDMIRDFNMTAERNISLLERKIEVMKRLLEKHGVDSDIEARLSENNSANEIQAKQAPVGNQQSIPVAAVEPPGDDKNGMFKKLGNRIIHALHETPAVVEIPAKKEPPPAVKKTGKRLDIVTGLENPDAKGPILPDDGKGSPSKIASADMKTAFTLADGRKEIYELVSYYYDRGVSSEEISRASGLPVGEISLVVSIQSRKG